MIPKPARSIFRSSLPFLFFLVATCSNAEDGTWKFSNGTVAFSIRNAGITVKGTFGKLTALVLFNPDEPANAKIEASVPVQSIETGINLRNKHLKKPEYFDAARFPEISLRLIRLEKDGTQWKGNFDLTIKGVRKNLTLPVTFSSDGNSARIASTFTINRLDFKVGESSWTMSDDVSVQLTANLIP